MKINEVTVRDGVANMDFGRVTQMLSRAKWSPGIGTEEVRKSAQNSALVVGAFHEDLQVGYARVISDRTRFACISDVYVDEDFRHNGIARKMLAYILSHASLKDVYQWLLRSSAHELYQEFGFVPVSEPERWMEIRNPRPER